MLVDAEQLARDNRALRRRLKEAKLKIAHASALAKIDPGVLARSGPL
jgi:hypothetical protein